MGKDDLEEVRHQVYLGVWGQVREQVWGQVQDQVWDQVEDQARNQVWAQVWDKTISTFMGLYRKE